MAQQHDDESIDFMEKELIRMEVELQQIYASMGKTLLEMAWQEEKYINQLVDKIIVVKKQLSQAKGDISCSKCMTSNSFDSKYCRHCGAKLLVCDVETERYDE